MNFSESLVVSPEEKILASQIMWEHTTTLPGDEVCPDVLAEAMTNAVNVLLDTAGARSIALAWATLRARVHTVASTGDTHLVVAVDVL